MIKLSPVLTGLSSTVTHLRGRFYSHRPYATPYAPTPLRPYSHPPAEERLLYATAYKFVLQVPRNAFREMTAAVEDAETSLSEHGEEQRAAAECFAEDLGLRVQSVRCLSAGANLSTSDPHIADLACVCAAVPPSNLGAYFLVATQCGGQGGWVWRVWRVRGAHTHAASGWPASCGFLPQNDRRPVPIPCGGDVRSRPAAACGAVAHHVCQGVGRSEGIPTYGPAAAVDQPQLLRTSLLRALALPERSSMASLTVRCACCARTHMCVCVVLCCVVSCRVVLCCVVVANRYCFVRWLRTKRRFRWRCKWHRLLSTLPCPS